MATQKKKDDELPVLLIVLGLFLVVMICIDLFYSAFDSMPKVMLFLAIGLHGAGIGAFVISVIHWKDPNKDNLRKWSLLFVFLASITVAGYKVYENENNQVLIDSEKAKQENTK